MRDGRVHEGVDSTDGEFSAPHPSCLFPSSVSPDVGWDCWAGEVAQGEQEEGTL